MNEFKFQFVNFLLLALLVFGMYWAFTTINNGVTYGTKDLVTTDIPVEDTIYIEPVFETPETSQEISYEIPTTGISSDPELSAKLQGLVDDAINMKQGSQGTRVGTIQKFLNIYFKTSKTVDGDYGPGTLADIKKFQNAEGLSADGLAGSNTYKKMIEVLKQ